VKHSGRVIGQEVNGLLFTAEVPHRARDKVCGICGEQSAIRTLFFRIRLFFSVNIVLPSDKGPVSGLYSQRESRPTVTTTTIMMMMMMMMMIVMKGISLYARGINVLISWCNISDRLGMLDFTPMLQTHCKVGLLCVHIRMYAVFATCHWV
jgi:hypothetical protein